jgi:UDP-glucose-4-epimerase
MAILVTGGAGYIGTHTCTELLNYNEQIVIVDNFSNSKLNAIERVKEITGKKLKFYNIDLLDGHSLAKVFSENQLESVIHFAGLKAVGESVEKPLQYYQNNITGSLILLNLMKKFNVKNLVFSSSAAVYGSPKKLPIKESFPLSTANPYGTTKLYIEQILRDLYFSDNDWSIAILRYFNPIGAHSSGKIGENPNGIPNNIMPRLINTALGKIDSFTVYGNYYTTKYGTCIRDYIHIIDLVTGHIKALLRVRNKKGIDTYNLGTGIGYSVSDIIKAFEETTCMKLKYHITPRRPRDVACMLC